MVWIWFVYWEDHFHIFFFFLFGFRSLIIAEIETFEFFRQKSSAIRSSPVVLFLSSTDLTEIVKITGQSTQNQNHSKIQNEK